MIIYDCPNCGQGGLEFVRIKSNPPLMAVVCSECDRIWPEPHKVGLENDAELGDFLPQLGLTEDWSNLECIHPGVDWDSLDDGYQLIVKMKAMAKRSTDLPGRSQ